MLSGIYHDPVVPIPADGLVRKVYPDGIPTSPGFGTPQTRFSGDFRMQPASRNSPVECETAPRKLIHNKLNPRQVLVVDDDPHIRKMLKLGLEGNGFEVTLAASGRDAIELFRAAGGSPSVALLDVRMPDLDGPHTLDSLLEVNPHLQACFMSADIGDYERAELIRRGAQHVLDKPFTIRNLLIALEMIAGEACDSRQDPAAHEGRETAGGRQDLR
jgi:CheY-like chemotaxis protein